MNFRRFTVLMLTVLLMLSPLTAFAAQKEKEISLFLNDSPIHSDVPPFVDKKANLTMVPLRVISESLGAQVDSKNRVATIHMNDTTLRLIEGSKMAKVNDANVELDAAATVQKGRVMVPLRFVAQNLGINVVWDGIQRSVLMTSTTADNTNKEPGTQPNTEPNTEPSTQPGTETGTQPNTQNELRGAWVPSVYNIDWPSKANLNKEKQQAEFIQLLDDLKDTGLNAVFVQVRPTSDAFYPSQLVPWSKYLTGTQGKDPGYDPLAFMIEETHRRNMEFHAWFNPFRISVDDKLDSLVDSHPAKIHPDWVVRHQGKLMFDPGIPAARDHIIESIMEVVRNYDIDGIHLDDYFYPYGQDKEPFPDAASFAAYNNGQFTDKADWRRDNVNQFVKTLGTQIHQVKNKVQFGISPFGVWRNKKMDPTGSDTSAGLGTYDDQYADVRTWIQNEWIDYVAPQIYWHIGHKAAPYDKLVDWWVNETRGTKVKLYIGHAAYKLGTKETGWASADTIINQLDYNKKSGQVSGSIYYSSKNIQGNVLGIRDRLKTYYAN